MPAIHWIDRHWMLESAAFEVTQNEIFSYHDTFDSVDGRDRFQPSQLVRQFLRTLPVGEFTHRRERLAEALESRRSPRGIELTRRLILATTRKPLAQ